MNPLIVLIAILLNLLLSARAEVWNVAPTYQQNLPPYLQRALARARGDPIPIVCLNLPGDRLA